MSPSEEDRGAAGTEYSREQAGRTVYWVSIKPVYPGDCIFGRREAKSKIMPKDS